MRYVLLGQVHVSRCTEVDILHAPCSQPLSRRTVTSCLSNYPRCQQARIVQNMHRYVVLQFTHQCAIVDYTLMYELG
jgi:hypothetical protein